MLHQEFGYFASECRFGLVMDDTLNSVMFPHMHYYEFVKEEDLLIVGEKEQESGTVSVRKQGGEDKGVMSIEAFTDYMKQEIAKELE